MSSRSTTVRLPRLDGTVEPYDLGTLPAMVPSVGAPKTRIAYAAAHVVSDPLGDPVGTSAIDWDATLAFRRYLWDLGLGVAEAMDTAQRGGGLPPHEVPVLIDRSINEAITHGGAIVCGITTDDLAASTNTLDDIVRSYRDQLEFVEDRGGSAVMMASRALAATARSSDDYAAVYGSVLSESSKPVILHWLGTMFDPQLNGYWGSSDSQEAMENLVSIVTENAVHIDGVKVSMLDEALEVELRTRLPPGVRCYTGDDFHFPDLIAGSGDAHSDALLGIFDAIAPVAITALHALDDGDTDSFARLLDPTVALSRLLFQEPTFNYKTGLTFLAYLGGHQDHFRMLGGQEGSRSVIHLGGLVRLADAAGLFPDPDEVVRRLAPVLHAAGVN